MAALAGNELPLFPQTAIVILASAISVAAPGAHTGSLRSELEADASDDQQIQSFVKDITATPGTVDVSVINTLGRIQKLNQDRPALTEITFTMVNPIAITEDSSPYEWLMGTASSVSEFNRVQHGEKDESSNPRQAKAILFFNEFEQSGTNPNNEILLNNAFITDLERSLDSEGHEELTVTAKCLAADTYASYDGTS